MTACRTKHTQFAAQFLFRILPTTDAKRHPCSTPDRLAKNRFYGACAGMTGHSPDDAVNDSIWLVTIPLERALNRSSPRLPRDKRARRACPIAKGLTTLSY